jgi:hypothetical protein
MDVRRQQNEIAEADRDKAINGTIVALMIAFIPFFKWILIPWILHIRVNKPPPAHRGGRINRDRMPPMTTHLSPAPPRAGSISKPTNAPPTPMSNEIKMKLQKSIYTEDWTRGRHAVINEDTCTISLFNTINDKASVSLRKETVETPLNYLGVPVIPHHYPYFNPNTPHILFRAPQASTSCPIGLTDEQERMLRSRFPGTRAIDFYIDGQVIIGLTSRAHYANAISTLPGVPYFQAWEYKCLLVVMSDEDTENGPNEIIPDPELERVRLIGPGSKIWNAEGEYSTLGTFLHPDPRLPTATLEIKRCSVSAHSFLRKVDLGFNLNPPSFLAIGLVRYIAYLGTRDDWLPREFVYQLAYIKTGFVVQVLLWRLAGNKLGWHQMVVYLSGKLNW